MMQGNRPRSSSRLSSRKTAATLMQMSDESSYYDIFISAMKQFYEYLAPWIRPDLWNHSQWVLFFSAIALMFSTLVERVTFKMAVDHMTPYRLDLLLFIILSSIATFWVITFAKRAFTVILKDDSPRFSIH